MLVASNNILTEHANRTLTTDKVVVQLINYDTTHSEAIARYHEIRMVLHIYSKAYFLINPGSKIISVLYQYLSAISEYPIKFLLK